MGPILLPEEMDVEDPWCQWLVIKFQSWAGRSLYFSTVL